MSIRHEGRVDNLAVEVNKAVDEAAEHLRQYMLSNTAFRGLSNRLQRLAMTAANVTAADVEYMSEHDDNNPSYQLFYAELSLILQKVLARAADGMSF